MVRNVTDVDDSILPKARELGVPYLELADSELARFRSDMEALELRPAGRGATRHRGDRRHDRDGRDAARDRARVRHARHRVLRRLDVPALRRAVALLARPHGAPRAPAWRQPRRPAPARPARLRAVAAVAPRRAGVARAVRGRAAGLARRVLGDGDGEPRHRHRPARRRHRPHLPAPRVRDRAEREHHRRAVLPPLGALGDGELRGREDVEVARQPRVRERSPQDGPTRARSGSR